MCPFRSCARLAREIDIDVNRVVIAGGAGIQRERRAVDAGQTQHWQLIADVACAMGGGLGLVNLRRCYCGEGAAAHAMYRLNGAAVSLYIIPDADRSRASAGAFGHDAVIWAKDGTTYVLLSSEPRATLETL